jgi:hypothetical protein
MIVRRMEPVMEMDRLLHMHTMIAYTAPEQSLSSGKSSSVRAHIQQTLPVTSWCSSIDPFDVYYRSTVHVPRLHEVVDKRDNDGAAEHRRGPVHILGRYRRSEWPKCEEPDRRKEHKRRNVNGEAKSP